MKKENRELLAGCREATDTLTKAEGVAEVQTELKEKVSEVDRLEAQLQQKETEIAELQTHTQPQVAAPVATGPSELHGKVVLAETEAILQQLQNSVEQEEKKWSGKVSQSNSRDVGETTRDGSTSCEVEVVETPVNVDPLNAATPTQLSPQVEPRETRPRRAMRMPKKYKDFLT